VVVVVDSVLGLDGFSDAVQVGHGGYGVVYRAVQDDLHRAVAVKVLSGGPTDGGSRRRFERERLAMGALSGHPAIVMVHESGFNAAGRPYLVMEYMAGGSLADRLAAEGPMSWQEAVAIGARIASGLEAAHAAGLLHRDVKPENLLVSDFGEVKLSDFGIASLTEGSMTATHTVTASVAHAGPEILEGKRPSEASDVYSLGSTVFALISGRAAFRNETDESVVPMLTRVLTAPVPDLRPLGVPDSVAVVLERAMAKDPADRYQSARDFREALEHAARAEGLSLPVLTTAAGTAAATTIVGQFIAPPVFVDPPVGATVHQTVDATPAAYESIDSETVHVAPSSPAPASDETIVGAPLVPVAPIAGAAAIAGSNSQDMTMAGVTSPFATSKQPIDSVETGRPKRNRGLVMAAIIAAVVLLAGGIAAALVVSGGNDSNTKVTVGERHSNKRVPGADTTPPPLAITTANQSIVGYAKGVQDVVGTSEPGASVGQVGGDTTTADASGNWKITINLGAVGANAFQFIATDKAGNQSAAASITFYQQEPPTVPTTQPRRSTGGGGGGGSGKGGSSSTPPATTPAVTPPNGSTTNGGAPPVTPADPNAAFESLQNQCHALNWGACDSLFNQAPAGSTYATYGGTCGHATNNGVEVGNANGSCAYLVSLQGACYNQNWASCDSLYDNSPSGGFRIYGDTCAYRIEENSGYYCTYWASQGTFG
jgi:Protein kinase domain/Bacterial Ig domain